MSNSQLSDNLKYFRKKRGLSQQTVADTLKIDRSTYSYYEIGKTEPNIEKLTLLCQVFNTDFNTLLSYCGEYFVESDNKYECN